MSNRFVGRVRYPADFERYGWPCPLDTFSASPMRDRVEFRRAFRAAKIAFPACDLAYVGYADGAHYFQEWRNPLPFTVQPSPGWRPRHLGASHARPPSTRRLEASMDFDAFPSRETTSPRTGCARGSRSQRRAGPRRVTLRSHRTGR